MRTTTCDLTHQPTLPCTTLTCLFLSRTTCHNPNTAGGCTPINSLGLLLSPQQTPTPLNRRQLLIKAPILQAAQNTLRQIYDRAASVTNLLRDKEIWRVTKIVSNARSGRAKFAQGLVWAAAADNYVAVAVRRWGRKEIHGVWIVWASGESTQAREYPKPSQHRKIVEVPSMGVVVWWNLTHRTFSMIVDLTV